MLWVVSDVLVTKSCSNEARAAAGCCLSLEVPSSNMYSCMLFVYSCILWI